MSSPEWLDDDSDIETLIRAAGDYVQPSRDLRPRVVAGARLRDQDRRAETRLAIFVLAVLLLCIIRYPVFDLISDYRHRTSVPGSVELQRHALQLESQPEVGPHWGMTEAFYQLRQYQAHRLGQPTAQ